MSQNFSVGDCVELIQLKRKGNVVSGPDSRGNYQVRFGGMEMCVPATQLILSQTPLSQKNRKRETKADKATKSKSKLRELSLGPIQKVDLHGMRPDEAIRAVERALDQAILINSPEVHIIHGVGSGSLKQTISNYLSNSKHISHYKQPLENPGLTIGYL